MSAKRKSKSDNEDGEILVELLKDAKIFNDQDGNPKWRIKVVDVPKNIQFHDYKPIDFMGYAFIKKETGDIYLNPPKEINNLLKENKKHIVKNEEKISSLEDQYGSDGTDLYYGYYKISSDKKSSIEKMENEIELDSIDLNRSDMRELSVRKMAEFLVQESPVEDLLACIASQAQYTNYMDNNALSEIADVLETIKPKYPEKTTNIKEIVEDDEEVIKQNELKESIARLEKLLKNPDNSEEKNDNIEKQLKKLKKELTNGFGSSSLQSNRGILTKITKNQTITPKKIPTNMKAQKKRMRSMKNLRSKKKKMKSLRRNTTTQKLSPMTNQFLKLTHQNMSKVVPKNQMKKNSSNKKYLNLKMRKHRSRKCRSKRSRSRKIKRRSKKTRSFGSNSIYGLQNVGPYTGFYQPIFPNLNNVVREYNNN